MTRLRALLWDVDGTLAETERDGHRVAFNRAFEACGLPWRWEVARYGELLHVTGGRERLLHDMRAHSDAPVTAQEREALARAVHDRKNAYYAEIVRSAGLHLRPGVRALMDECQDRGVDMGIATTTSRSNVDALLGAEFGPTWPTRFAVVLCGEDVQCKKPDPEVYLRALAVLRVDALAAVALEDSPGGVAAARAAGLPVIVTRSAYFADATIADATAIGPGLDDRQGWRPALRVRSGANQVVLDDIEAWCTQMDSIAQFG